ncbi:EsaB/YukD family protein [Microbacterium sp. DT81.1]|uniref:EsaB/YukD family protein n=1 Tax=Microbacterium sp. DT81.1 TaxID=3393413 RepID=UPI003CEBA36A
MTGYTRITLVGERLRGDVVVPDDEPFVGLLPELLDLIGEGERFAGAPVQLVRRTGQQLDLSATAGELAIPDGDVLRVVHAEEAPPPPEVADVTDVVAESLVRRSDRWGASARQWVGGLAVGAGTLAVAFQVTAGLDRAASVAALVVGYVASLAAAIVFGRLGWSWSRRWTTAVALGIAPPLAVAVGASAGADDVFDAILAVGLAWIAIGVGFGLAARSAPAAWGALAGSGATAAAVGLALSSVPLVVTAAIVGLAALVVIGILPPIALAASGLSRLDDAALAGSLPSRRNVQRSLDDAYASLAWLCVALSVTAGAAAVVLVLSADIFAVLLGVAIALVLALRTRQFPLVSHVVPLWAGAVATILAVAYSPLLPAGADALVLVGLAIAAIVLVGVRPSAHGRVRLRRWGNALELLAVISTVPLLLGVLDVYPDLLRTFG